MMMIRQPLKNLICIAVLVAATKAGAQEKTPLQFAFGVPAKGNAIAMAPA